MATTLRFRKASDKDYVMIPEVGRVVAGQVLEGPQWKRYVKIGLLEEIPISNPLAQDEDIYIPAIPKLPDSVHMPPLSGDEPEDEDVPADPVAAAQAVKEAADPDGVGEPTPDPEDAPEPPAKPAEKPASSPKASSSGKMKKRAAARRKR